jgi:hypothetical protein
MLGWLSPLRVTVTFVMVPAIPETLTVDGYGVAAVGGAGLVRIEIGDGLEKTTAGAAIIGRVANDEAIRTAMPIMRTKLTLRFVRVGKLVFIVNLRRLKDANLRKV